MRCLSPIRLKNPSFPEESSLKYIDCACGKCFNCLVNRRRLWFFRLFYESVTSQGNSYFVGFDYAPKFSDGLVHKEHVQRLFKRLRKAGLHFKYYAIGEYGTDDNCTHHPHYHALMFFDKPYTQSYIDLVMRQYWPFGRVHVGYVEPASINYVLHYHVRPKRPFGDDDKRETFSLMSQGLGLGFLDEHFNDIVNMLQNSTSRKVTNPFGDTFVLPRYYVKKLKDYGVVVKEFDGSDIDWSRSNMRDIIDKLDDSFVYNADGSVIPEQLERWLSLMNDVLKDSKRKLQKYDSQKKVH